MIFLGLAKMSKSFPEFVDFVLANEGDIYGVVAGRILPECNEKANQLKAGEMTLVNRYITEEELLSLYGIADLVWCYYGLKYGQSSGVFGRALQLGITPVIRKNSIVERIANDFGLLPVRLKLDPILITRNLPANEERGQEQFNRG